MLFAQKSRKRGFFTDLARWMSRSMVDSRMRRAVSNFQILDAIISLNSIDMMNNLSAGKESFDRLFNNKSMFSYIPVSVNFGMEWFSNKDVSTIREYFSTFPVVVGRTLRKIFNVTFTALLSLVPSFKVGITRKVNGNSANSTFLSNHYAIVI